MWEVQIRSTCIPPSKLFMWTREYLMIYRGPSFLAVTWFGSLPPSRQQAVSLSQSACVSPDELTDGRGVRGWGSSQTYDGWKSLALYKLLNTLWCGLSALLGEMYLNVGFKLSKVCNDNGLLSSIQSHRSYSFSYLNIERWILMVRRKHSFNRPTPWINWIYIHTEIYIMVPRYKLESFILYLFNVWGIGAMDRISAQPQVKLSFFSFCLLISHSPYSLSLTTY